MIAGINEILTEDAPLIAIIGSSKIFPMIVPEGTEPPFLSTSLARTVSDEIKTEISGFRNRLVNINIHANDYDTLDDVEEALITALDNKQSVTDTGHTFTRIYLNNAFDRPDLFTTERPLYARTVQFNAIVKR